MKNTLFLLGLLLLGCTSTTTHTNRKQDIDKAKVVSSAFYTFLVKHKSDSVFVRCSNAIRNDDRVRSQLQYVLENSILRFGEIKNISLVQANSIVKTGAINSEEYRFTYKVLREKHTTKENFILANEDGKIRVFTYGVEKFQ